MLTLLYIYVIGFVVCLIGGSFLGGAVNALDKLSIEESFDVILENWVHALLCFALWPILGFSALGWVIVHLWQTRHGVKDE